jgi:hypothetical protein
VVEEHPTGNTATGIVSAYKEYDGSVGHNGSLLNISTYVNALRAVQKRVATVARASLEIRATLIAGR